MNRLEQQLAQHRASLAHLDATMQLFDPDIRPDQIRPRQQRPRNAWFRPGECLRLIHDVLRDAPRPVTARALAERIMAMKGIPAAVSVSGRPPPVMGISVGCLSARDGDSVH